MNNIFRKKLPILSFLLLLSINIYGQSTKIDERITPQMANRIGLWCSAQRSAFAIFSEVNSHKTYLNTRTTHSILYDIRNNLDCARNFILKLYQIEGVSRMERNLIEVGFTTSEIKVLESIYNEQVAEWREEKMRANELLILQKRQQEIEEEEATLTQIAKGSAVFSYAQLYEKPQIDVDISKIGEFINEKQLDGIIEKNKTIDYEFRCKISTDKEISLINHDEIAKQDPAKVLIWDELKRIIKIDGDAKYRLPIIDTVLVVPTNIRINIKQGTIWHYGGLEFVAKKKNKGWKIMIESEIEDKLSDLNKSLSDVQDKIKQLDTEGIYSSLNNNSNFIEMKSGRYNISIDPKIVSLRIYIDSNIIKEGCMSLHYNCKAKNK